MRLDLLLYRLRLARSRGLARAKTLTGYIRVNGIRVRRASHAIAQGDTLTLPRGKEVLVCKILHLPERRGPAAEAQSCYRVLDPDAQSDLAEPPDTDCRGPELP